jgi:phosphopantothenoylcysteine decarboxylase
VVLTAAAKHFWERAKTYNPTAWQQYEELVSETGQEEEDGEENKRIEIYEDKHEWEAWDALGDSVVHIDLRAWADILLIAPLSANSLGKIANGLCDNLLTSIVRAWDVKHKPVLLAPAMNTHMWEHPFTARHLGQLQAELGYHVIPPVSKLLACGDTGQGGLAAVDDLVEAVQQVLANEMDMGKEGQEDGGQK